MVFTRSSRLFFGVLVFSGSLLGFGLALVPPDAPRSFDAGVTRKAFFRATIASASTVVLPSWLLTTNTQAAVAAAIDEKLGISDDELKAIVTSDILEKQFLVTGDITRSIYKPSATFTDEIDTYNLDQWVKGTQKLFVGSKSDVRLVGDVLVSPEKVEFRFDENLCFNIPFKPVVSLSGKVVLDRDDSGFITSYREFWDQDVATVLKSAKF